MEIVIGYQGKYHVTAGQVGRIMAGMAGSGTYVLETQNRLAATVVTANQVRVDTGDLVMQGRVATVETPETLTIESGVTGQKRRDLIVARYTMEDSTAVEGIELAVVKGTPVSYGEPSDPEVSEGSILDGDSPVEVPLYRVTVDGLTPGTPEALLDTVPSVDSLRDSVSQVEEKTDLVSFIQKAKSVAINAYSAGFEIDVTCTDGTYYALGVTDGSINFFRNGKLKWTK